MSKPSAEALQLVKSLMELPENSICADCQKKAAKWASSTLGVFICIDCSGIHRSLGTHISFVRSCTLDSWTPEQARLMRRVGNRNANEYWEARLPRDFIRPATGDRLGMEAFIRAKYIEKRWAAQGIPPHLRTAQHNPTGGSVKPSINMYEGYFQHNPMAQQQQQPSYSIMGSTPVIPPSRSNDTMKKKKFATSESGHRPFFAASGSPTPEQRSANHSNSMNLDEFMNKMNSSHQSNENLDLHPAADSQEHSSFDFLNQGSNNSSSTDMLSSNEVIELNSTNPFGPGGTVQESPLTQNSQPPPTIESPIQLPHTEPVKHVEKEKTPKAESSEHAHIPHPKAAPASASLSAQEIMQQQQQEPSSQKAFFTGKKKQSLFGKKSKACRFAKKATSPSQEGNFVVDQMLNIAESSFRPVSAPVYQLPPKQMTFTPSAQQQYNYMMNQSSYQQTSSDFSSSQPTNIYEQTQQNLYQQPPQNIYQQMQQNLYQQPSNLYQPPQNIYQQPTNLYQQAQQNLSKPPQNIYEQTQQNLYQQPQNIYQQQPNYYQQPPPSSQQPQGGLW